MAGFDFSSLVVKGKTRTPFMDVLESLHPSWPIIKLSSEKIAQVSRETKINGTTLGDIPRILSNGDSGKLGKTNILNANVSPKDYLTECIVRTVEESPSMDYATIPLIEGTKRSSVSSSTYNDLISSSSKEAQSSSNHFGIVPTSGLTVFDLDVHAYKANTTARLYCEGLFAWVFGYNSFEDMLNSTVWVRSQSGGYHFYFDTTRVSDSLYQATPKASLKGFTNRMTELFISDSGNCKKFEEMDVDDDYRGFRVYADMRRSGVATYCVAPYDTDDDTSNSHGSVSRMTQYDTNGWMEVLFRMGALDVFSKEAPEFFGSELPPKSSPDCYPSYSDSWSSKGVWDNSRFEKKSKKSYTYNVKKKSVKGSLRGRKNNQLPSLGGSHNGKPNRPSKPYNLSLVEDFSVGNTPDFGGSSFSLKDLEISPQPKTLPLSSYIMLSKIVSGTMKETISKKDRAVLGPDKGGMVPSGFQKINPNIYRPGRGTTTSRGKIGSLSKLLNAYGTEKALYRHIEKGSLAFWDRGIPTNKGIAHISPDEEQNGIIMEMGKIAILRDSINGELWHEKRADLISRLGYHYSPLQILKLVRFLGLDKDTSLGPNKRMSTPSTLKDICRFYDKVDLKSNHICSAICPSSDKRAEISLKIKEKRKSNKKEYLRRVKAGTYINPAKQSREKKLNNIPFVNYEHSKVIDTEKALEKLIEHKPNAYILHENADRVINHFAGILSNPVKSALAYSEDLASTLGMTQSQLKETLRALRASGVVLQKGKHGEGISSRYLFHDSLVDKELTAKLHYLNKRINTNSLYDVSMIWDRSNQKFVPVFEVNLDDPNIDKGFSIMVRASKRYNVVEKLSREILAEPERVMEKNALVAAIRGRISRRSHKVRMTHELIFSNGDRFDLSHKSFKGEDAWLDFLKDAEKLIAFSSSVVEKTVEQMAEYSADKVKISNSKPFVNYPETGLYEEMSPKTHYGFTSSKIGKSVPETLIIGGTSRFPSMKENLQVGNTLYHTKQ